MATIEQHFGNIKDKLIALRKAINQCKNDTGYFPQFEYKTNVTTEVKGGKRVLKIEKDSVLFDGFWKTGEILYRHPKTKREIMESE